MSLADVNGDNQVNLTDMVFILQMSQGMVASGGDLLGDVNSDGRLDKTDADLLLSYVQEKQQLTARGLAVADTNRDGKINILDCVWILNVVSGKQLYPVELANISSGWYKIVPVRDSSKAVYVFTAPGMKFVNESQKMAGYIGKPLALDTYTGKAYQKFYVFNNGDTYKINAGNCALNIFSNGGSDNAVLAQYEGKWVFVKSNSELYIASATNKGKVLTYSSSINGMLSTETIANIDAQRWRLIPVDAPTEEEKNEDIMQPIKEEIKEDVKKPIKEETNDDIKNPTKEETNDDIKNPTKEETNEDIIVQEKFENYAVVPPCQNLLLREAENNKCRILAKIPKGSVIKVFRINGDWAYAEFNGQKGYVFVKFLQKA